MPALWAFQVKKIMLSEPKNSETDGYALFFTTPPTCFPWSAFSCVATTWNMIHRKRRNPVWYSTMKRMRLLRWEVSTGTFYSAALWWSLSRDVKQDSCGKVSILLHVISDHLSDTKKEDVLEWELKKKIHTVYELGDSENGAIFFVPRQESWCDFENCVPWKHFSHVIYFSRVENPCCSYCPISLSIKTNKNEFS